MIEKYDSYYKKFANQTLNWLPSDTQELYNKNLKDKYNELEANGWIDNHFTYQFNSHGFRSQEFTNDPTVMCLGCSITCGIGLPVDSIWPEILAKKLNMRCANLGIGGSSMDTAFRLASGYIDKVNPKLVVCLRPIMYRLELIFGPTIHQFLLNNPPPDFGYFYATWTGNDINSELNSEKNLLAIQMLCQSRNIKFVSYDLTELYDYKIKHQHLARDLSHPGSKYHKDFVEKILANL